MLGYFQSLSLESLNVIVAFSALAVSVIAVGFSYQAANYQRLSTSATLLASFTAFYDSAEMRQARRTFAEKLLDEDKRQQIDLTSSEKVLELFEEIGYLTRRKVFDKGMVWNHFFWFLERYHQAVSKPPSVLERTREEQRSSAVYEQIDWLYCELRKFNKKGRKLPNYSAPSDEHVKQFLLYESKLDT